MNKDIVILLPEQWRISLMKDKSIFSKWDSDIKKQTQNISILDWQDNLKNNQKVLALAFDLSIAEFILQFNNLENFFLIKNFLYSDFTIDLPTIRMIYKARKRVKYHIKPTQTLKDLPKNIISYIKPGMTLIEELDK